mgnify:CR=1 FL=1
MPLAQQPQDAGVIVGQHRSQIVRSQCCDRDRSGVVGIVLLRPARGQGAHPRRPHGRHIDDGFAGCDELLGEEVAEPLGGLDRPRSIVAETVSSVA